MRKTNRGAQGGRKPAPVVRQNINVMLDQKLYRKARRIMRSNDHTVRAVFNEALRLYTEGRLAPA